jgi:uncharacterized protein YhbP (UPF0306 family)
MSELQIDILIKKYLSKSRMMQIATVDNGQPWICTVYCVEDEDLNLYWLSLPARRHSQEIKKHNKIAIAVPVKFDTQPIIGIQAQGVAEVVKDKKIVADVMKNYVDKYDSGKDFYDNFIAGKNEHWLYKFIPEYYMLFDEVKFKGKDGQKMKVSN